MCFGILRPYVMKPVWTWKMWLKVTKKGEQKEILEDTDEGGFPDIVDGDNDNDGVSDDEDDMEDDADEEDSPGHGKPDWWQRKYPNR